MKAIHPADTTTAFLNALIPVGTVIYPHQPGNDELCRFLTSVKPDERLYLLGHGMPFGMYDETEQLLIKSELVPDQIQLRKYLLFVNTRGDFLASNINGFCKYAFDENVAKIMCFSNERLNTI